MAARSIPTPARTAAAAPCSRRRCVLAACAAVPLPRRAAAAAAAAPAPPLRGRTCARGAAGEELAAAGIVFQPFQEVEEQLSALDQLLGGEAAVPGPTTMLGRSIARTDYADSVEAAVNEQINVEHTIGYVYHSVAAFMDRDAVGLPGFAAYFSAQSHEERRHAELLMSHQNRRGGRVKLQTLLRPESEFADEARGEALWALELSLGLERLNFGKLRQLHAVATSAGDAELTHFIEDYLLHEQAKDVKAAADLVSRARRAGPGLGVFELDVLLQRQYGYGLLRERDGDGAGANGAG